jgi:hypothetical protein
MTATQPSSDMEGLPARAQAIHGLSRHERVMPGGGSRSSFAPVLEATWRRPSVHPARIAYRLESRVYSST